MEKEIKSWYLRCNRYGRTEIYFLLENHPWYEVVRSGCQPKHQQERPTKKQ